VPYKIHTVLTDNGIQFRFAPRYANGPTARYMTHMFAMRCQENGIEHRFTKINHPWTNGQVERMNRTIKDATVKRFHYDSHDQLRRHLNDFVAARITLGASSAFVGSLPTSSSAKHGQTSPNASRQIRTTKCRD
jgi:transposase InsO family protein